MTFSIVAFDKDANEVGFAIASCCWNAGSVCAAKAGLGVITHQHNGDSKFHPIFFEQLNKKKNLEEIIDHFRLIDDQIENRQIGLVSIENGTTLSFTGKNCSYWAGHKKGDNYACQGNMLVGPEVIDAMTHAFENTQGSLSEKLYASLVAGEDAGGDARGKQSARLHIKRFNEKTNNEEVVVDFIIMDHDDPIKELGRFITYRQNYRELNSMLKEFEQTQVDKERQEILAKIMDFMKDKKESRYMSIWTTLGYAFFSSGNIDEAINCYKIAFDISPSMVKTVEVAAKKAGIPESVLKRLLEK
ncbi:MAG: DUF1028 domain-containing protein [Asgard group archaeon]|nr:DUF1028 domain-containing protein [Asgard group archaeon]